MIWTREEFLIILNVWHKMQLFPADQIWVGPHHTAEKTITSRNRNTDPIVKLSVRTLVSAIR